MLHRWPWSIFSEARQIRVDLERYSQLYVVQLRAFPIPRVLEVVALYQVLPHVNSKVETFPQESDLRILLKRQLSKHRHQPPRISRDMLP